MYINFLWVLLLLDLAFASNSGYSLTVSSYDKRDIDEFEIIEDEAFDKLIDKRISSLRAEENDLSRLLSKSSRSQCVHEALREIIPRCISNDLDGLESHIQKHAALKLSICEFENSKILYPSSCVSMSDETDFDWCISELEKAPQYWTTFSGYYRELTRICHEESLPYEKGQIVSLYTNITKVYKQVLHDMRNSHMETTKAQSKLKENFQDLVMTMKAILDENRKEREVLKDEVDDFAKSYREVMVQSYEISKQYSDENSVSFQKTASYIEALEIELAKLSHAFNDQNFQAKQDSLKRLILSDMQLVSDESNTLFHRIMSRLEDLEIVSDALNKDALQIQNNLKESRKLSEDLNQQLSQVDEKIHEHSEDIIAQFENTLNEIVRYRNEAVENAVRANSESIAHYTSNYMYALGLRLDETAHKLEDIIIDIEELSNRVTNASSYFLGSMKLLTNNPLVNLTYGFYMACGDIATGLSKYLHLLPSLSTKIQETIVFLICILIVCAIFKGSKHLNSENSKLKKPETFRIFFNLALWGSIFGGTVAAFVVFNTLFHLKLYISQLT